MENDHYVLPAASPPCSVILDCHHVSSIDYTAVVGLAEVLQDLHKHGISLVFCSLQVHGQPCKAPALPAPCWFTRTRKGWCR